MKILLAEDEPLMAKLIRACLPNHEITTVTNGWEAKEKLKQEKFDILITDQNMPGPKGTELIELVREETKTILITAQFIQHNAHFFLLKPFSLRDLKKIIEE